MKSGRQWTTLETDILRHEYPDSRTDALATLLGRSRTAVAQQAGRLGLKKSPAFMRAADSGRLNGARGYLQRFPPGNRPWNKGRQFIAGGRSAQTRFKPGQRPKNEMPIGSYRIDPDGYLEQKTSASPGPSKLRWTPVHRLVWESAHGPVDPGHVVVFKPGRRSAQLHDITLDALELITRAELMARNSLHNLPPELVQVIRMRGVLNRRINERSHP